MDTWSLNNTGSRRTLECTRGMLPNQLANLFMQLCRWAKWSGSAHRDALEVCRERGRQRERGRDRDKQRDRRERETDRCVMYM